MMRIALWTLPIWIASSIFIYWIYNQHTGALAAGFAVAMIWILWAALILTGALEGEFRTRRHQS